MTEAETHRLNCPWGFWFKSPVRETDWSKTMQLWYTFPTVEGFWCFMNTISSPFKDCRALDCAVFRDGISPDYEKPEFESGGRIIIKPSEAHPVLKADVYESWKTVLVELIGENLDDVGGSACAGLRLVYKRTGIKFEIWCTTCDKRKIATLCDAIWDRVVRKMPLISPTVDFESFRDFVKRKGRVS